VDRVREGDGSRDTRDKKTDAIGIAKNIDRTETATLLERFKENPVETRHTTRVELGLLNELAAEMFAVVIFVSDGLLQIKDITHAARFFKIATQLPLELQMVLCFHVIGSAKEIVPGKEREMAFKELAKRM